MNSTESKCEHVFTRRRDGKRCLKCGEIEFGEEFTDNDRQKLRAFEEEIRVTNANDQC